MEKNENFIKAIDVLQEEKGRFLSPEEYKIIWELFFKRPRIEIGGKEYIHPKDLKQNTHSGTVVYGINPSGDIW